MPQPAAVGKHTCPLKCVDLKVAGLSWFSFACSKNSERHSWGVVHPNQVNMFPKEDMQIHVNFNTRHRPAGAGRFCFVSSYACSHWFFTKTNCRNCSVVNNDCRKRLIEARNPHLQSIAMNKNLASFSVTSKANNAQVNQLLRKSAWFWCDGSNERNRTKDYKQLTGNGLWNSHITLINLFPFVCSIASRRAVRRWWKTQQFLSALQESFSFPTHPWRSPGPVLSAGRERGEWSGDHVRLAGTWGSHSLLFKKCIEGNMNKNFQGFLCPWIICLANLMRPWCKSSHLISRRINTGIIRGLQEDTASTQRGTEVAESTLHRTTWTARDMTEALFFKNRLALCHSWPIKMCPFGPLSEHTSNVTLLERISNYCSVKKQTCCWFDTSKRRLSNKFSKFGGKLSLAQGKCSDQQVCYDFPFKHGKTLLPETVKHRFERGFCILQPAGQGLSAIITTQLNQIQQKNSVQWRLWIPAAALIVMILSKTKSTKCLPQVTQRYIKS